MKLLSLWQPHASAMALGLKTIETRGKRTSYRGMVAIHAAKKWDGEIIAIIEALPKKAIHPVVDAHWTVGYGLPRGCIVAIGELVDCVMTQPGFIGVFEQYPDRDDPIERALGNYDAGRFGWVFNNLRRLKEPLPYRGSQCMLDLPDDVEQELIRRAA